MSTVKEMQELLELGTQMGFKDEALQNFVKEEQSRLRDERERQREERKSKEEREHQLQLEKERTEREREEREHILQMEASKEHFAYSEHKRKMEEMEIDHKFQLLAAERSHKVLDSSSHGTEMQQPIKGPKLPAFDDSKDNIDAYIQRFEIYATSQKWRRDNWGAHLSALLKGKALDVFSRLPPESALDFDELKKALLKRFDMTEDGFRKKFRSSCVRSRIILTLTSNVLRFMRHHRNGVGITGDILVPYSKEKLWMCF
ncbi:E3 ubiquitin-protein ligase BRE1A-like [Saccostrea cucullata]|uniref:E3 ubiquitin-protein ligase BRE1A-like n=1 Tax=Saccostrea cuccullata TaxID=36930 RepID=UPI002ED21F07